MTRIGLLICLAVGGLVSCAGDEGTASPVVDQIGDALAAIDEHYGAPQDFFEISADLEAVGIIVAVDGATAAEQGAFRDGVLDAPEPVGEASGSTFRADAVQFDPESIFDQIRAELDDPVIVDFAITGGPDGAVVYDATVASDSGGVILILLNADGAILGVQAG